MHFFPKTWTSPVKTPWIIQAPLVLRHKCRRRLPLWVRVRVGKVCRNLMAWGSMSLMIRSRKLTETSAPSMTNTSPTTKKKTTAGFAKAGSKMPSKLTYLKTCLAPYSTHQKSHPYPNVPFYTVILTSGNLISWLICHWWVRIGTTENSRCIGCCRKRQYCTFTVIKEYLLWINPNPQ